MRIARPAAAFAAAVAIAAALAGCVEYEETMVIGRDGSGTVSMTVSINETVARAAEAASRGEYREPAIVESIDSIEGLRVLASETVTADSTRRVSVEFAFDSPAALDRLDQVERYQGLFGRVTLTEDADDNPVLTRSITIDADRFVDRGIASAMLGPVLTQYPWRYELRLPTRVVDTNGTVLEADDHVVAWEMTLRDVVADTRVMQASYAKSGLRLVGVAIAAGLMLIAIGAALVVSRRRRRGASG